MMNKYSTANAESDYTDRETDREETDREETDREETEQNEEQDSEGEDQSCATVITLKHDDSQDEDLGEETGATGQDGHQRALQLLTEAPSGELSLLLAQSDILHTGDSRLQEEGHRLLQDNRQEYEENREFVWRLARAHSDMFWCEADPQRRRDLAQQGLEEAELALQKNGLNKDCHKWFAVLANLTDDGNMHSKLRSLRILKEHLDQALALTDTDPLCFFLLGKWCYQVATLDWLERKAAAALYDSAPSSSLQEALLNFMKAEELSPGFSKTVRLYIAKVSDFGRLHLFLWFTSGKRLCRTRQKHKVKQRAPKVKQTEPKVKQTEAKVTQTEAKVKQTEAKVTQTEAKVKQTEAKVTQTEAKVTQTEPKVKQTEAKVTQTEAKVKQTEAKVTQTEAKVKQTEAKVTQTEAKVKQTEAKVTQTEAKVKQTEAKVTQTEAKVKQTEAKVTQTEAKVTQTEPKVKQTEAKVKQAEPKVTQTEPKVKQGEPKVKQTEAKVKQTEPKVTQTEA
uniref:Uncharacterized protein n=1 Tax=Knipowitschia caucasica TaxID=637954 RepID=A0AAV2KCR7_KNICA